MNRRDNGPARPSSPEPYLEARAYPEDPGYQGVSGEPRPAGLPSDAMRTRPERALPPHASRPTQPDPVSGPWPGAPGTRSPGTWSPGDGPPGPPAGRRARWARATRFRPIEPETPPPPNGSSPTPPTPPPPPGREEPRYGPGSYFDVFAPRERSLQGNHGAPVGNVPYGPPGAGTPGGPETWRRRGPGADPYGPRPPGGGTGYAPGPPPYAGYDGPAQPGPARPGPTHPGPARPGPAQPGPAHPGQAHPGPARPSPVQPRPTQPWPTQPGPVQGAHPYAPAGPGPCGPGHYAPGHDAPGAYGPPGQNDHPYGPPPGAGPGPGANPGAGGSDRADGTIIRQRDSALPDAPPGGGTGPIAAIENDNITVFARDLRVLRAQAGLDYPGMAEKSHYTMRTLASAAGGLRLPTLPVLIAYVRACGGDEAEWEERWSKLTKAAEGQAALPAAGTDTVTAGEVYVITSAPSRDERW